MKEVKIPNYVFPKDYSKGEKIATLIGLGLFDVAFFIILIMMIILAI